MICYKDIFCVVSSVTPLKVTNSGSISSNSPDKIPFDLCLLVNSSKFLYERDHLDREILIDSLLTT